MKNIAKLLFVALGVAAIASCNKEMPEVSVPADNGLVKVLFALPEGSPMTRATTEASESNVNRLDIAVVNGGSIAYTGTATQNGVSIEVNPGTYDVYAFVNAPSSFRSGFDTDNLIGTSISTLVSAVSKMGDNSATNFIMSGNITGKAIDGTTGTVVVPVSRHSSKVILQAMNVDFTGTPYVGKTLTIKGIYMSNVFTEATYEPKEIASPAATESLWLNKFGTIDATGAMAALTVESGLSIALADGGSNSTAHYFYPYPNATNNDVNTLDAWSVRDTRLVIQARMQGESTDCYYHINIPDMKPNHKYVITAVNIKNLGGPDPEHNLEKQGVDFTVDVLDWETGFERAFTFE